MSLAQRRTPLALLTFAVALATVVALLLTSGGGVIEAQGQPPPGPVTYSGTITIGGAPAPDGLMVVARIPSPLPNDDYESQPRTTSGGKYRNLIVGPTSVVFNYRSISFHVIAVEGTGTAHLGPEGLTAAEVVTFLPGPNVIDDFDLTFPAIPPAPEPTSTHTPVPTNTPVPEDTPTPEPTNTPEPTATPEPTNTPEPTATPEPTSTPTATPTPTPEPTPTPTATALPPTPIVVTATPTPGPTPEPPGAGTCGQGSRPDGFVLLAGLGLLGLVWMRRRRDGRA